MSRPKHLALDLFAGAGGWDLAAAELDAAAWGVELMPEARDTRAANGLLTHEIGDVWRLNELPDWEYDTLLASPPCQAYSAAGSGAGRKALDAVLAVLHSDAVTDIDQLRHAAAQWGDERIGLVLTPMTYVHEHWPLYIALEQVPPVLPVWEAMAALLRTWGYKTWTGLLSAEQYGVPQTRKRAILIARADGVQPTQPAPTHSAYYPRDPERRDAGVTKWISMAEALGWGATGRPTPTVTGGGTDTGGAEPFGNGARQGLLRDEREGKWKLRSNYGTSGDPANRGERDEDEPAPTVTSKVNRNLWQFAGAGATSQETSRQRPREEDEPAHTVTTARNAVWLTRPATTLAADNRVAGPGRSEFVKGGVSRQNRPGTVRVTVDEAAKLQSFPEDFRFSGRSGKQYLQIGNAIPVRMAEAVLRELWGE